MAGAVIDDIAASVRDATLEAVAATHAEPPETQAVSSVRAAVHSLVDDPRRAKVLLGGVAATPAVHEHRVTVMTGLTAVLIGHARTVHEVELEHDPLALVTPAFIVGGTAEAFWRSSTALSTSQSRPDRATGHAVDDHRERRRRDRAGGWRGNRAGLTGSPVDAQ